MKKNNLFGKTILICFLLLLSCNSSKQVSYFSVSLSPHFQEYNIQRVFFVPLEHDKNLFSSVLQDALAKNKAWEVFSAPLPFSYPLSFWNIPASTLSYIDKEYHAQAIALGQISHFSLAPMRISLKWFLVSAYDGKILYSIEGTWEDKSMYSLDHQDIPQHMASLSVEKFFSEVCSRIIEKLLL